MRFDRFVCVCGVLAALATAAEAEKRRAFVTSVSGKGDIASWPGATGATVLDKADSICRARASAGSLPNPLTYRAWLSTTTTDAFCHVQGLTGKKETGCGGAEQPGGGPWYLYNGITTFTPSLDVLTGPDRVIYRGVYFDELGNEVDYSDGFYWTGTRADGTADEFTCQNWSSPSPDDDGNYGSAHAATSFWTKGSTWTCDVSRRLLCFEPGESETTQQGWQPSAIAFVTSESGQGDLGAWPEAGDATGLDAGDAICRNLAAAAHLPAPDSFVAWLSDATTDARDRVTVDADFRRIDGYPIAFSRADLLDGDASNSLHVDEHGNYVFPSAYTGTAGDGTATTVDCGGWTSPSNEGVGTIGWSNLAQSDNWTDYLARECNFVQGLYCFSNAVTVFWDGFDLTGDTSRWSQTVPVP